jgi:hypothetical protein
MDTSLQGIYAETAACVALLRECGRAEDAEALDRALYGATSGEALALIGASVVQGLSRKGTLPAKTRYRLVKLRRSVDAVLRDLR